MAYEFTTDGINPDALKQSTHWFDRNGKEYLITKMTSPHAQGARRKLFGAFGGSACHTPLYKALEAQGKKGHGRLYG